MMRMLQDNTTTAQIPRLQIGPPSLRNGFISAWATFTSFVLLNAALGLYLYLYLYLYSYARW
jgi:hypothetical protein